MLKQNGGGIADHEVGTGKTLIMCVAAHEMKRLGLVHKPMIIGLKANVREIAETYRTAYPNARVLYASEKDETERRRNSRPRGGHRQDADHVRGCARDEAAGAGTQTDDNRSESQCARDSGDLPHGIPQRPRTVRIGEGLRGGQPRALLQRHTEQRLGLRHHVARPVREDTAVTGAATADIAGGAGHGGGKSGGAPLAGQGCVTRHAEGIGEAQVQPDGQGSWTRWRKIWRCSARRARMCHAPC